MSRDLTTLATVTGEAKRRLRDVRTALVNRREGLAREEVEEKAILAELDALEAEFAAALAGVRAVGQEAPQPTHGYPSEGLPPMPGDVFYKSAQAPSVFDPQKFGPQTLTVDGYGPRAINRASNDFEEF